MILLLGYIAIDPAAADGFAPALKRQVEASRAEDGCVHYSLSFDPVVPGRINVAEIWRDQPTLDAHRATAHMAAWREALSRIGGADRRIDQYEIGKGRPG